ncbi:MAG: flagellar hook-associated protein FlgL [Burkholderiales bacterium]|nr:flagellar hook-associated protein FlgL [Burkholderiales bacterium]
MRITTANAYDAVVANLQLRQQQLVDSQTQLTSGKRVQRASDDPAAAAQAERALAWQSRVQTQQRALDASRNATQMTESTLGSAGELLQQAREAVVQAGNGSYSDSDRAQLAQSLQSLRDQLFALSNTTDGTGRYLFGGQGSDNAPFSNAPGGVQYNGTPGVQNTAGNEPSPLAVDGQKIWLQAPDPSNPGGTLSVFGVLDQAIADLGTPGRTPAQVAQTVSTGLRQIDAVALNLSSARSTAGEALNRIDAIDQRLSQANVDAQQQRSSAEDVDMVQAISDFQAQQTGYDAALKAYATVQRMSLFQYLS